MTRYSSDGLGFHLESGLLYAFDPRSGKRARVTPGVVSVLSRFARPTSMNELIDEADADDRDAIVSTLSFLVEHGFLRDSDSEGPDQPSWDALGHQARAFHAASWDVNFVPFRSERSTELTAELSGDDPPDRFKSYPDARRYYLPRFPLGLGMRVDDAFRVRRTHRDFSSDPVGLDEFATALQYTFGFSRLQDTGAFGPQFVKVSPAGGSRHDIEAYVLPFRVDGIEPGVYHYNVLEHSLEHVAPSPERDELLELVAQQPHAVDSAFSIFMTTTLGRITYKYQHPRAYRIWMYNAGHAAQTFALVAAALGLGPFQTAAFLDSGVSRLLGLDPDVEFPTYMIGAGHPAQGTGGLPVDFRPAGLTPQFR